MKLIVGLGNPGRQYAATRHNVGWWALDEMAASWGFDGWKKDGQALVSTGRLAESRVRLLKPQTYMNLSGETLIQYRRRPAWNPSTDLLIISDDVALPVGSIRIRANGSAGGHNGLKSVEASLGTQDYARLKIGIRPSHEFDELSDLVLAPFSRDDAGTVKALLPTVRDAAELWVHEGVLAAANKYNTKRKPPKDEEN